MVTSMSSSLVPPSNLQHKRRITPIVRMSWRNQGITGSNNIPLGKRRFADDEEPASELAQKQDAPRGRDPEPRSEADGPRRRKKRNRWGDSDNKAAGLMGLPTAILSNMTSEQLEAYTLHLRIEEISQKLRIDDVVPADGDRYGFPAALHRLFFFSFPPLFSLRFTPASRNNPKILLLADTRPRSPSPAPQYDNHGRRINTREYRYRKKLEDERHKLIEKAMKTIPNYHPPQDYRRPTKTQEKVYVPVNDYPEINFSMIANPPNPNQYVCFFSHPFLYESCASLWSLISVAVATCEILFDSTGPSVEYLTIYPTKHIAVMK